MKTSTRKILTRWRNGDPFLPPLRVRSLALEPATSPRRCDACLELELPGEAGTFRFLVEAKANGTPLQVQAAIYSITECVAAANASASGEWLPLIVVPYLNPERLAELEQKKVSGVDLCGNGVVVVPGRVSIVRSGQPNLYPDSRPLAKPFAGKSALVGRMLLAKPGWENLTALVAGINQAGGEISLPQASKTVQALVEDMLVVRTGTGLKLQEPLRLLDQLGKAFVRPTYRNRRLLRLSPGTDWVKALSAVPALRWEVTGESSVRKYAVLGESGPWRVAVDDLDKAAEAIGGTVEPVPAFADIELVETDDAAVFFQSAADEKGLRWASRVQCWLELQSGDARQQQAANDVRDQILKDAGR